MPQARVKCQALSLKQAQPKIPTQPRTARIERVKDLLKDLNEPQQQAVIAVDGPVLILAGAGSGKTKALTHRIAYLIEACKVAPASILAVTFTNKAAEEMRQRVAKLLGVDPNNRTFMPYLGTFHSVCVRLLRAESAQIGLPANFTIFDSGDSLAAIKQAMRQIGVDEKRFTPGLIRELISSAKNELLKPQDYERLASGQGQQVAARVYYVYDRLLKSAGGLDFDDLIMQTVEMFRRNPEILSRWQERMNYILIDEYQDTNQAQYQLVKMLAQAKRNICVVGDDWQSIYSWRGANFQNILDFEKDYPDALVVKLERNYRSTKNILAAASHVITKNSRRSDKRLWTDEAEGEAVAIWSASNEMAEAEMVVREIERLVRSGYKLRETAVLYRTNAQSRPLEDVFVRNGLPYKMVGGVRFYERREVKDILAYLKFIYQPDDVISFNRIINLPARGLGHRSLELFQDYRLKGDMDIISALDQVGQIEGLTPRARTSLAGFAGVIHALRETSQTKPLSSLIKHILDATGFISFLDDGTIQSAERVENVQELISVAKDYDEAGIASFLEEVALITDLDSYAGEKEGVTLMTLHSAKGLEFRAVFMVGMEEGIFPHSRSLFDAGEMEEERRLCYVGMTRARQRLYLLHASSRMLFGKIMRNPASQFLADLPSSAAAASPAHVSGPSVDYKIGDRVRHATFGEGIITAVRGDEAMAAFAGIGAKKLSLSFAPLEKI